MSAVFEWKKRDPLTISVAILQAAVRGGKKTHIQMSARLSFDQLNRYLNQLKVEGFITEEGELYLTTDKGLRLLREYNSSPLTQSILR